MSTKLNELLGPQIHTLGIRGRRAKILAGNIANADTPRYLARDVDFEAAVRSAVGRSTMSGTDARHMSGNGLTNASPAYRIPTQPAVDGNTVDVHAEKGRFTENAIAYQIDLNFASSRIRKLIHAFRGD